MGGLSRSSTRVPGGKGEGRKKGNSKSDICWELSKKGKAKKSERVRSEKGGPLFPGLTKEGTHRPEILTG